MRPKTADWNSSPRSVGQGTPVQEKQHSPALHGSKYISLDILLLKFPSINSWMENFFVSAATPAHRPIRARSNRGLMAAPLQRTQTQIIENTPWKTPVAQSSSQNGQSSRAYLRTSQRSPQHWMAWIGLSLDVAPNEFSNRFVAERARIFTHFRYLWLAVLLIVRFIQTRARKDGHFVSEKAFVARKWE